MARVLYHVALAALTISAPLAVSQATAADITPDVIFGDGNANGAFTIDQENGIELGLRGKLRFNENNSPENTFNYDGVDTYTFPAGTPPTGFGFDQNSPTTPVWNFEWSINTNYDGTSSSKLSGLNYTMRLDGDPGPGVDFTNVFDPINDFSSPDQPDHAIGDNNTSNGDGTVADDVTEYSSLIDSNNVAQNSWSYEFFNDGNFSQLASFDPNVAGLYSIELQAFDSAGDSLARTSIDIQTQAVPVPGTVWLVAAALAMLGAGVGYGSHRSNIR